MDDILHISVAVPAHKLGAFYSTLGALLGGVAIGAMTAAAAPAPVASPAPTPAPAADPAPNAASVAAAPSGGDIAGPASDDGTLDSAGWPWSPELHASTKGVTKEGLWRMKVGVSRPDPKPGFPKEAPATGGTGTAETGAASQAGATAATDPATSTVDDDDEFAAFRAAADKSNATDAAAAASVAPRKWADADLGKLCNQAAVKLGDPTKIKELIAEYCGADVVPHSRNVPEDKREAFATAIEKAADIVYEA